MKVIFTRDAWFRINLYIKHATGEVSGLGVGILDDVNKTITITDLGIWEQECTSGETEVTSHDEMITLAEELISRGAKPEEINVWWHSHANMSAFFSGTDENTIKQWVNNRFILAVVGNKKGEFKAKLEIKQPIRCQLNDLPVECQPDPAIAELQKEYEAKLQALNTYPEVLEQNIIEEVAAKVKQRTYTAPKQNYPTYGGFNHPYNYNYKPKKKYSNMSPEEKYEKEVEWALKCLCDECWEYNEGTLKVFPIKSHNFRKKEDRWIPKSLEQRQLSEQRLNESILEPMRHAC